MSLKNMISTKTIVILALILAILLSVSKIMEIKKPAEPVVVVEKQTIEDSTIILERVERLSELASNKYYYSNVVAFKDNMKIRDFQVPFTQKSFLIKYDGYLKAGIDAQDIEILSNDGKAIELRLKNSKILDHAIDEKSIYVYDEKNSVFNNLSINDVFDQLSSEKDKIEAQLEEKGFLRETDDNIRLFLDEFLKDLGYERVTIMFETH